MTAQEGRLREENVRIAAELRRIAALSAQGADSELLWAALREVEGRARYALDGDPGWLKTCGGVGLNIDAAASQFGISEARESDGWTGERHA